MSIDIAALNPTDPRSLTDDASRLDWGRPGLSARSRRVMMAAAEALYSDEDERGQLFVPETGICERAVDGLDRMVGNASGDLRRGFSFLTFALQILPLFLIGRLSLMTSLSLEDRVRYFEALEHCRVGLIAMLFVAIKVPMTMSAFEEGEELASSGFDRPDSVARRRLPVMRSEARATTKAATAKAKSAMEVSV